MDTKQRFALFLFLHCLLLTALSSQPAIAATIQVNTEKDIVANDGACTLREAIIAANTDAASGLKLAECAAGNGVDTIKLPAGTYVLSLTGLDEDSAATGDLDVLFGVSINGDGADKTMIDGGGTDRVFHLLSNEDFELNDLTIRKGDPTASPGAILSGGGIFDVGNSGTLTLNRCAVTDNTAGDGGGIMVGASVILVANDSTISGNKSKGGSSFSGGGIFVNGSVAVITNTTISGNMSGGEAGGISNSGTVSLNNVTIAENEAIVRYGGVSNTGTFNIRNSIIAGNTSPMGPDCGGSSGLNSLDYNLIQNTTDCTVAGQTAHNITGQNAQLGPLAHYGGHVQTVALLLGSPAINAGNIFPGSCSNADPRGVTRAPCDMGAYEKGVCGDNLNEPEEQCEEGNTITEICVYGQTSCQVCSNTCQLVAGATSYCGDGTLDAGHGEGCDLGVQNSSSGACLTTCVSSKCGDGQVQSGVEQCDLGTGNNKDTSPDTCRTNCTNAHCGDGIKDTGEDCDIGNGAVDSCSSGTSCNAAGSANACHCSAPSSSGSVLGNGGGSGTSNGGAGAGGSSSGATSSNPSAGGASSGGSSTSSGKSGGCSLIKPSS